MKITTKGQVTIPLAIREKMGMHPDSEVVFEVRDNQVILRKSDQGQGRLDTYLERVRGRASSQLSTDEIMALTRGPKT
jgi:AbrB family looped-hinge helix DNA binding protein